MRPAADNAKQKARHNQCAGQRRNDFLREIIPAMSCLHNEFGVPKFDIRNFEPCRKSASADSTRCALFRLMFFIDSRPCETPAPELKGANLTRPVSGTAKRLLQKQRQATPMGARLTVLEAEKFTVSRQPAAKLRKFVYCDCFLHQNTRTRHVYIHNTPKKAKSFKK